jgi:glycine/D-amino acid oxidase-like deaminating enzyme
VRAKEVVLATNAHTGRDTPWHRRRVFPVRTHMIATEDLGPDGARRYIPQLRMISDTRRMLAYFRPSPDGRRILFGGRASWRGVDAAGAAPRLRAEMAAVFPELASVPLTHAWTGEVAITFDRLAHTGNDDGLRFALGCNGTGVVLMTWLGRTVAREILGSGDPPSAFAGLGMPTLPLHTGNPWMLPAIGAWYVAGDRIDRWRAGR